MKKLPKVGFGVGFGRAVVIDEAGMLNAPVKEQPGGDGAGTMKNKGSMPKKPVRQQSVRGGQVAAVSGKGSLAIKPVRPQSVSGGDVATVKGKGAMVKKSVRPAGGAKGGVTG